MKEYWCTNPAFCILIRVYGTEKSTGLYYNLGKFKCIQRLLTFCVLRALVCMYVRRYISARTRGVYIANTLTLPPHRTVIWLPWKTCKSHFIAWLHTCRGWLYGSDGKHVNHIIIISFSRSLIVMCPLAARKVSVMLQGSNHQIRGQRCLPRKKCVADAAAAELSAGERNHSIIGCMKV